MTDRSWTFRTAATIVAIAAASATFSTFAVAQAAEKPAGTPAVDRQDPQLYQGEGARLRRPVQPHAGRPARGGAPAGHRLPGRGQGEGRLEGRPAQGPQGRQQVRRARPREDRQDLHDPRRVRRPGRPPLRRHTRPAAQPDRGAGPQDQQQHRLAGRLRPGPLPGPVLRRRQRHAQVVLREAVLGPLLGRRRGHRLGQGALQRGPLRLQRCRDRGLVRGAGRRQRLGRAARGRR